MKRGGRRFLKGGAVLAGSQAAGQLCSLGRNIIVARMISPADFGIAAIFLLVITFLEMVSNLSLDRLLVQSPDGDEVEFQGVAHLLQVARGVLSCALLLAFAYPLAHLFSIPHALASFYVLALIPFVNGFIHLDPRRVERHMRFVPNASVEFVSQVVVLAAAWPVCLWLKDFRAMLLLLILKAVVMIVGSHLAAERAYRWSRNREYASRFVRFGWPLLINGVLMFFILQGDRFILGSAKKLFGSSYDMGDVGLYSAAFILAMMPAMLCIRVLSSLFLPMLSKKQHEDNAAFLALAKLLSQGIAIVSLVYVLIMLLVGDSLLLLVYGSKYETAAVLVGWFGVFWAIRIIRTLPASISMAKGNTINLMYANLLRVLFLGAVVWVVVQGWNLVLIVAAGIIGECCAYFWSLVLNKRAFGTPLNTTLISDLFLVAGIGVIYVVKHQLLLNQTGLFWLAALVFLLFIIGGGGLALFSELRIKLLQNWFGKAAYEAITR